MTTQAKASSIRIIASAVYDALIILGLLMVAGAIAVGVNYLMTGQEAISQNNLIFQFYLLTVISSYYLYFWSKSGQTVGMKAWRLKVINLAAEEKPGIGQLLLRQLVAIPAYGCLFLGVLWQNWDPAQLNWHDRASRTKLIYIPKKP